MPKRKFGDYKQGNKVNAKVSDDHSRHERAEAIIKNGCTHVARALTVAKGFERPKLSKRQQAAGDDQEKIKRLDAEITALKELDAEPLAKAHVYKTLLRIKTLSESGLVPSVAQETVDAFKREQSQEGQNVQARLFKYPPVKAAVDELVKNVRGCLPADAPRAIAKSPEVKHERTSEDKDRRTEQGAQGQEVVARDQDYRSKKEQETARLPPQVGVASSEEASDVDISMDEDMIESFDKRIAESEDEDLSDRLDPIRRAASDWSGSEDDLDELYDEHDAHKTDSPVPPSKPKNTTKSTSKAIETVFLPTLSMGGYLSGSEDASSIDDETAKVQPRKNRRGQRERQKIHEKKYGANASHLKKAVWDPRRGAQEASSRTKWKGSEKGGGNGRAQGRNKGRAEPGGPSSSGANTEPLRERAKSKSKSKTTEAPMHPSWEAARKAKEQKQAAPFQGKKTTFD